MATASDPKTADKSAPVASVNTQLIDGLFAEIGNRQSTQSSAPPTRPSPVAPRPLSPPVVKPRRTTQQPSVLAAEGSENSGRFGWWPVRIVFTCLAVFGAFLLFNGGRLPTISGPNAASRSSVASPGLATKPIEDVEVGDRTCGRNPLREQVDPNAPEPDPKTWRKLVLRMKKESGGELRVNLLRPLEWIETTEATAGGTFFLDLPEMGAVGDAYVEAIEPCPPIKPGRGNVVTGTFHHEADPDAAILQVEFSNGAVIKGVTDNHPFWSEDRQEYVPAGNLKKGDRVRVNDGIAAITSISSRLAFPGEMLYNLEVHNEHVYQVTTAGILVHNSCGPNEVPTAELNPTHRTNVRLGSAKKEYEALKADIRVNGIKEPIKYVEHGGNKYIVDGHHRLRAAKELGIKQVPAKRVELPYGGYRTPNDLLDFFNNPG